MTLRTPFVAAALIAMAAPPSAPAAPPRQDFRWAGAVAAGERVELRGIHGSIRAEPSSGREVEVTAVRRTGNRGSAQDVRIETVRHGGGVTICALYMRMRLAPHTCNPDAEWGGNNDGSSDVRVEWVVRVPRGVHFAGETLNGNVEARSMSGNASVSTVNGDVTVSGAGEIDASTVNGAIRAVAEGATPRALRFHSVNGSILVQLPANFRARVRASSFNGSIATDYPLDVRRGGFNGRRVEGEIGGGGDILRLETLNGRIEIRRSGGSISGR